MHMLRFCRLCAVLLNLKSCSAALAECIWMEMVRMPGLPEEMKNAAGKLPDNRARLTIPMTMSWLTPITSKMQWTVKRSSSL
ncbi:hypothetical protein D3C80_1703670 [compost metagenome]